jgi:hypothetical protein
VRTDQIAENSYLFTFGESRFFDSARNRKWYREAREPVFENMQSWFWFEHFADQDFAQLIDTYRALELPADKSGGYRIPKPAVVSTLVRYFQKVVSNADPK